MTKGKPYCIRLFCFALMFYLSVVNLPLWANPENFEPLLLKNPRQITFVGKRSGEGYFSPDGNKVVFQSERDPQNPFYQIFVYHLKTGEIERISPGIGKTTCGWFHPKGEKLLFSSTHLDPQAIVKQKEKLVLRKKGKNSRYAWDYDPFYDIFEWHPEKEQLTPLTDTKGYDAEANWSPDGEWIVFASNREAYLKPLEPNEKKIFDVDKSYFVDIYLMHKSGKKVTQLTTHKGYDGGPFFSPDGKRIVWRRFTPDGTKAEIWTMNLNGGDKLKVTNLEALSWGPFYHPSGKYIIFSSNKNGFGNFELYLVDVNGKGNPIRVTQTKGFDGLPVFSPDGTQLLWTSNRVPNKTSQLFLADWDHQLALSLLESKRSLDLVNGFHQTKAAIDISDLKKFVNYLSGEKLEGRLAGSHGEKKACRYLAAFFHHIGLKPFKASGELLMPIPLKNEAEGHNVIGRLYAGEGPSSTYIIVGAHIDHLGRGEEENSLAKSHEKGKIHFGADDNASGVGLLMELAHYLATLKKQGQLTMKHDIVFAAWSGEEMGILGSNHFVKSLVKPNNTSSVHPPVVAYLNMDMVGRLRKQLIVQGLASSSIWPKYLEKINVKLKLSIVPQDDCYLPTDTTPFYLRGVPILNLFTGSHAEYHTPRDIPQLINYQGMVSIGMFMAEMIKCLLASDKMPEYQKVKKPKGPARNSRRVYLGTIPDYAGGGDEGVLLTGVAEEGPAEKAGLKAGDTIVKLNKMPIRSLRDYAKILGTLKPGETVLIEIRRNGQILDFPITPTNRD